jgi:hypothetical protein
MTYLSQRMREIREEERRRKEPAWTAGIDYGYPVAGIYWHKRAEFPTGWSWGRGA